MTLAHLLSIVSSHQVGGGGSAAHHDPLSCLGLLFAVVLLPIVAYSILKVRSFAKGPSKDKPDFTSLRSTGKSIVNDDDHDDTPNSGGVN